jgi:D-sedoheptulose 7-phosphate isomerase
MGEDNLIQDCLGEIKSIADSVSTSEIARIVVILYEAWASERTIYLCGNGGSSSTASHFACDLVKLGIKAQCLNDNPAILTMLTNDNGFDNLYTEQLKGIRQGDVLVCFSVHGGAGKDQAGKWSQNLLKAIEYAKSKGAKTIGFVGFDGGAMKDLVDASLLISFNSTPQVESWHLHIAHIITYMLSQYKPVKVCDACGRFFLDDLRCSACHSPNYKFAKGIFGNIEEIRKQIGERC